MNTDTPIKALPLPITTLLRFAPGLVFLAALYSTGCAASAAEVRQAKQSGYEADFATVYSEAMTVVSEHYPHMVENATTGLIQTAWHIVTGQTGSNRDNSPTTSSRARGQTSSSGGIESVATTAAHDRKKYFVRFRVHILGGKPWRIRIKGEASVWSAGDVPMPLKGAEIPSWLEGRTDALRVEIYRKLKKYAVPLKVIPNKKKVVIKVKSPESFGEIPKEASAVLTDVYVAVKSRMFRKFRKHLASDVLWSLGSEGDADMAMVMWQADTSLLDTLVATLELGCHMDALQIVCEKAQSGGPRVVFEKRNGTWLLISFLAES